MFASQAPDGWPLLAWTTERSEQAHLLRHIVGNPFRSRRESKGARAIALLAQALYEGDGCAFALHDALLEAGESALADHFRGSEHPRGCWVLDLLLLLGQE